MQGRIDEGINLSSGEEPGALALAVGLKTHSVLSRKVMSLVCATVYLVAAVRTRQNSSGE